MYFTQIVAIFGYLFVVLFFISNSSNDMFRKWLKFTIAYFLAYFSGMFIVLQKTNSFYDFSDYVGWACWIYFIISLGLFIYDLLFHKKKHDSGEPIKEITVSKVKKINILLWIGGLAIFVSGIIEKSMWVFGTIYLGIPLLLYGGSFFLFHRKSLGGYKAPISGILILLLSGIIFIFWALSDMNIM